jgi:hypothetical protein
MQKAREIERVQENAGADIAGEAEAGGAGGGLGLLQGALQVLALRLGEASQGGGHRHGEMQHSNPQKHRWGDGRKAASSVWKGGMVWLLGGWGVCGFVIMARVVLNPEERVENARRPSEGGRSAWLGLLHGPIPSGTDGCILLLLLLVHPFPSPWRPRSLPCDSPFLLPRMFPVSGRL